MLALAFTFPLPLLSVKTNTPFLTHRLLRCTCLRRSNPTTRSRLPPKCAANQSPEGQPPSGAVLCGALEISFRNVWLRLMTNGVGMEYMQAIRAFVLASAASFKAGYSLQALKLELAANEKQAKIMGKDTRLNENEKRTRLIWLALVYMTLQRCRFPSERFSPMDVNADIKQTDISDLIPGLAALVESVCDANKRGYDLKRYKLELNLKKEPDSPQPDAAQASIRSQWARIVFSTLELLPGELTGRKPT